MKQINEYKLDRLDFVGFFHQLRNGRKQDPRVLDLKRRIRAIPLTDLTSFLEQVKLLPENVGDVMLGHTQPRGGHIFVNLAMKIDNITSCFSVIVNMASTESYEYMRHEGDLSYVTEESAKVFQSEVSQLDDAILKIIAK